MLLSYVKTFPLPNQVEEQEGENGRNDITAIK